jgi:pectate lyase
VRASNYVTVANSRFETSDKSNLIGNGDSGREWSDQGRLKVTMTGNHWYFNQSRMPRVRYGKVHLYNNFYQGSIASVPNRKWGSGMAAGTLGDILAQGNFFHVLGVKINAGNEICGKLVMNHGGGSGFRGENLWFQSDHASALTPQLVDAYLAGCDGLPLGGWQPPYAYTVSSDPPLLGTSIPATVGAGKLP